MKRPARIEIDSMALKLIDARDELNLAEFPLCALAHRPRRDQKTLHFQDQIWDERRGETVRRLLAISGADAYGLRHRQSQAEAPPGHHRTGAQGLSPAHVRTGAIPSRLIGAMGVGVRQSGLAPLAERTLGRGRATSVWLQQARPDRAMIMWQGILDAPGEIIRVQLPVPRDWLTLAGAPHLRLVAAWDSPVNAAVENVWASRKVSIQLRVKLGTEALTGSRSGHKTYPLVERVYDLRRLPQGVDPAGDLWLLELSYAQAAEYYPGFTFSPQQRLASAAELYDADDAPVSPQASLQALSVAASMQVSKSAEGNLALLPGDRSC